MAPVNRDSANNSAALESQRVESRKWTAGEKCLPANAIITICAFSCRVSFLLSPLSCSANKGGLRFAQSPFIGDPIGI